MTSPPSWHLPGTFLAPLPAVPPFLDHMPRGGRVEAVYPALVEGRQDIVLPPVGPARTTHRHGRLDDTDDERRGVQSTVR